MFRCSKTVEIHSKAVTGVRYCSGGNLLATCSADKTCHIVEVCDGKSIMELSGIHKEGVNDIVWLHGEVSAVATASDDQTIVIWDTERGDTICDMNGHLINVYCLANHPEENLLVSGSGDCTFKLWDIRRGSRCAYSVDAHAETVTSVSVHPSGLDIMTTSFDGTVRFWDIRNGQCLKEIVHDKQPPIGHGRYSPNGIYILTNSVDNVMRLLRPFGEIVYPSNDWAEPGNGNGRSSRPNNTFRCDMGMAPELKRYISHSSEQHCSPAVFARLDSYRARCAKHQRTVNEKSMDEVVPERANVVDSSSSDGDAPNDNHDVVIGGSGDGNVIVWDVITQNALTTLQNHEGALQLVLIRADGKDL